MGMYRLPEAFQKPRGTFHTGVCPFQRLLGWRREHGEQAYRIGAVLVDQPLRINRIALGLGHLGAVLQHHALGQQAGKRLGIVQQARIAHQLVEEPGVQQMQDRVFDAADVLVDRHPVARPVIQHAVLLVGAGVACEIPGGFEEGVEGIGLALRPGAAGRAGGIDERVQLLQR
jgi:hypothetical protein